MLIWPWKFTFFLIQPDAILNYVDNSMYLGKNFSLCPRWLNRRELHDYGDRGNIEGEVGG